MLVTQWIQSVALEGRFLPFFGPGSVNPPGKHSLRYPDTPSAIPRQKRAALSGQARTMATEKRRARRFEARARGQGQREVVQSVASASLQTSKQLLAYSSSDRKQKPGRLALFGRPRFAALVSVAFHPLLRSCDVFLILFFGRHLPKFAIRRKPCSTLDRAASSTSKTRERDGYGLAFKGAASETESFLDLGDA